MGEVYRARDSRLGREVAIKVIPEAFARDPDRLARFEREARSASSLSDPHIVVVHDVGVENGIRYFAAELVEGPDLRTIIDRGPMPVRRILDLGAQIAEGLAAAHEKGILHRDLKPENVLVSKDRLAKIADFGLAKIAESPKGGLSQTPTAAAESTGSGMIMGTVSYMSPEQARGAVVDHRSDQFALGSILYEMATGRKAFARPTAAETMTAILREEPVPLATAAPTTPAPLGWIVDRLLAKEPHERYDSTRDLARELASVRDHLSTSTVSGAAPVSAGPARRRRTAAPFVAGLIAGLAAATAFLVFRSPKPTAPVRFRYLTYSGHDRDPAVSPDGRTVAFSSDRDGKARIWLKQLDGGGEAPLTSGPGDVLPRFAPNGASILFTRTNGKDSALYRSAVVGGEAHKILDGVGQGDWAPDGNRIAVVRPYLGVGTTLSIVDASSGASRDLVTFRGRFLLHPRWSPDGRRISEVEIGVGGSKKAVVIVDAASGKVKELPVAGIPGIISAAPWNAGGDEVVYSPAESVVASVVGSAGEIVAQNVESGRVRHLAWAQESGETLDLLGNGSVVFDTNSVRENLRELPIESGAAVPGAARWLTEGNATDRQPAYSPDGKWVIFSSTRGGNLDLWKVSTESGETRQLTDDAAQDWDPAFTRDGRGLLWSSNRSGAFEIWTADADGSGARVITRFGLDSENPTQTADGKWIVYLQGSGPKPGYWKVHPDGTGAQAISGIGGIPDTSPDGKHVISFAISSSVADVSVTTVRTEDGKPDDYRADIPQGGFSFTRITVGRGRWMPDGKSILILTRDPQGRFVIDRFPFAAGAGRVTGTPFVSPFDSSVAFESFGVSPDGRKITVAAVARTNSLMVATNLPGIARPKR
jgi:serine/threonine protein kinase/Tol biopolymer transport system component